MTVLNRQGPYGPTARKAGLEHASMRILAHRGASGYAPENTYAAFELACRMSAPAIETDFRCTRDGVLVLLHDERVDRTTDGAGVVSDLTWQYIARLDAGAKYSAEFSGERVPRLDDFLDRYAGRVDLCLEAKGSGVVTPLKRLIEEKALHRSRRIELTSFEWRTLLELRAALPDLATGYLVRHSDVNLTTIDRLVEAGVASFCPSARDTTKELVRWAHERGLKVRVWGIQQREDYLHALNCGVDGGTLNWPDWGKAPVV